MTNNDKKKPVKGFSLSRTRPVEQGDQPEKPRAAESAGLTITPRQSIVSAASGGAKSQRIYIEMPSSKRKVECTHMLLDPSECVPSRFNIRAQALLNKDNQELMSLVDAIEADGQRDPVLARPIIVDGEKRYEVIYGTRRRAAVEYLSNHGSSEIKLRAWVTTDITDADAAQLALSENADRQDVSQWEKAAYIRAEQEKKVPVATIAERLKISVPLAYKLLQIASLPISVVSCFASPSILSITGGCQIAAKITKSGITEGELARLEDVFSENKARSTLEVIKAINCLQENKSGNESGLRGRKAVVWKSEKSLAEYSVRPHRSEPNSYSMSIKGVSQEDIESVLMAIRTACDKLSKPG